MAVQLPRFEHGGQVASGFDWDAGNVEKCRAHGFTKAVIESVFDGAVAVLPDPVHSASEARFIVIGTAAMGRFVFWSPRFGSVQGATDPADQRTLHASQGGYVL